MVIIKNTQKKRKVLMIVIIFTMGMNVFIAEIEGKTALLTPEESWHCAKVLRCKAGDPIHIIDGKGNFYEGLLTTVHEKKCQAEIVSGPVLQKNRNYYLHLAIAPTKNIDRIEWLIEKAVEIGIDEISFIRCKNSERTTIKIDRIRKIVESAVKQSLQATIPKINGPFNFQDLLSIESDLKFIAHCDKKISRKTLKDFDLKNRKSLVLIGPEGDFTSEEINASNIKGFNAISLGENRLRTETAGLFVCNAFALLR